MTSPKWSKSAAVQNALKTVLLSRIHVELEDLNAEAVQLAATDKKNFEELEI